MTASASATSPETPSRVSSLSAPLLLALGGVAGWQPALLGLLAAAALGLSLCSRLRHLELRP